jgi:hypothetical protein
MHVICYADACVVQGTLSNKGQYVNLFNNCSTTLETLFVSFTWSWSDLIDECFPGPLQRGADDGWTENHYRTLARLISGDLDKNNPNLKRFQIINHRPNYFKKITSFSFAIHGGEAGVLA